MITITDLTTRIAELEPLPSSLIRLTQIMSDKNYKVDECVEVIQYDQILMLEVLRFANAAFAGNIQQIVSIKDAIVRLGGSRILKGILARHLRRSFSEALPAYGYQESDLWLHSVASATAVEELAEFVPNDNLGTAFSAALLHDVGKLVLARIAPREDMEEVWRYVSKHETTCNAAEKEILGFTHAEVGAAVLSAWELPEQIVHAVRDHHAMSASSGTITDIVIVGNVVARTIGMGVGLEGMSLGLEGDVARRLNMTRDIFERTCIATAGKMEQIETKFGVNHGHVSEEK